MPENDSANSSNNGSAQNKIPDTKPAVEPTAQPSVTGGSTPTSVTPNAASTLPATSDKPSSLNIGDKKLNEVFESTAISDLANPQSAQHGQTPQGAKKPLSKRKKMVVHFAIALGLLFALTGIGYGASLLVKSTGTKTALDKLLNSTVDLGVPVNSNQNSVLYDQTNLKTVNFNGDVTATGSVTATGFTGNGSQLTNINASNLTTGQINNALLDPSLVALLTLQGNVLSSLNNITAPDGNIDIVAGNGASVTNDAAGKKITISSTGSNTINDIVNDGGNVTVEGLGSVTVSTNPTTKTISISAGTGGDITGVTAGAGLTGGGLSGDVALSVDSTVTTQGNSFNGISQLVQTTGAGALPVLSGVNLTSLNASNLASGTVADARLSANVTTQGNIFNAAGKLVQLNGSGELPALSGVNLTNLNATNIASGTLNNSRLSASVTLQGNSFNGASQLVQLTAGGLLPVLNGSNLTNLNATNISSGTLNDARLSTNVTLQGNTFNGGSQLVKLTAGGLLPVLNGSNLTNLDASNITAGTLNDLRLSTNVTLQGNTFNGASQLVQLNALGFLTALNGSNLTTLNASALASGTVADARLSANVALLNGTNTFSALNTFSSGISTNLIQPTAALVIGSAVQNLTLQGNASTTITSKNGANTTTVGFTGSPSGAVNYNFDTAAAPGTYQICSTIGNCASSGGGVTTGGGTTNKIAKFSGAQSIADSTISDNGTTVSIAGKALLQAGSDSTDAFVVQNAAGTSNLLVADTTNTRVGIGTATPGYTLDVNGSINATTALYVNGNQVCDSTGCTVGSGSGFYIQNGTGTQATANFNIQSINSTSVGGVIQGAVGQTADLFRLLNSGGTPVAKFDNSGNIDITGVYKIAGSQIATTNLSDNANIAKLNGTGPQIFTGNNKFSGTLLAQNASDSTSALQIQNAAGTSNLFVADTSDTRIGIATATPGYTLDVNGDINIASGSVFRINGVPICGVAAQCAPSAGSSFYIQNSTSQQSDANINIRSTSSGSVVAVLTGKTGQTADLLQLQDGTGANVVTFGASGATLFKNSTNSSSALAVQNASGASLFAVDTSAGNIKVGAASSIAGNIVFNSGSSSNTITLAGISSPGGSRILTLPDENGTLCSTGSICSGYASAASLGSYVQLQGTTPGTPQTGHINVSGTIIASAFSGSGAALTSLNASNVSSGTLSDSRLSANVPLLNAANTFTLGNTFSAGITTNTITPTGALTVGATSLGFTLQGSAASSITATSAGNTTTVSFATPSTTRSITIPNASGTICLDSSNCNNYIQNTTTVQTGNFALKPGSDGAAAYLLQTSGGTNLFAADTSASRIRIGTGSPTLAGSTGALYVSDTIEAGGGLNVNGGTIVTTSGKLVFSGAARQSRKIRLTAEYAGAVLSGSGLGTMTAGYDSGSDRMNYYNWTSALTSTQAYDVVVQVPIPLDWGAWSSTSPMTISAWDDDTSNGGNPATTSIKLNIIDSSNVAANSGTFFDATPTAPSAWQSKTPTSQFGGTFTAGDYFTIKIRLTTPTTANKNLRIGNITLDYLSTY